MNDTRALTEGIGLQGNLQIKVIDAATQELIRTIQIRNKITYLAADSLIECWAQRAGDAAPLNNKLYTLRVGTSNTAAARSDTNLGLPVFGVILADGNKVTGISGDLQIIATLGVGDANGNTLQEAGLFTKGAGVGSLDAPGITGAVPRLLAHQTHPPIVKTVAISLEYSWRISFTA